MPTVTPSVGENGEVTGFDFNPGNEGAWRQVNQDQDFIQDIHGNVNHIFQDVILDENDSQGFNQDDYADAVVQMYPQAPAALQWAADNLPTELNQAYNDAWESGDLDQFYQYLEYILGQYEETQQPQYEEEEQPQEDPLDEYIEQVDDETIQQEVESILSNEPEGEDTAYSYNAAAEQWSEAGYEVEAAILDLTSQFHSGLVEPAEAINALIERYGDGPVMKAYLRLQQS